MRVCIVNSLTWLLSVSVSLSLCLSVSLSLSHCAHKGLEAQLIRISFFWMNLDWDCRYTIWRITKISRIVRGRIVRIVEIVCQVGIV